MKSKGFNWFYLIFAAVLAYCFPSWFNVFIGHQKLDEKSFYALLSQNKSKTVVVLKDTDVCSGFLTPEAKNDPALARRKTTPSPMMGFMKENPDFTVNIGDLKYFQERYNAITDKDSNIKSKLTFDTESSPWSSFLMNILVWVGIMVLFYYIFFRKIAGGSGGAGGQNLQHWKIESETF